MDCEIDCDALTLRVESGGTGVSQTQMLEMIKCTRTELVNYLMTHMKLNGMKLLKKRIL